MTQLAKIIWNRTPEDYQSIIDGRRYVLAMRNGGTTLVPLESEAERRSKKYCQEPIKRLICSCCGGDARGRQWPSRDYNYGLCKSCADFVSRPGGIDADMVKTYGYPGIHYDIEEVEA